MESNIGRLAIDSIETVAFTVSCFIFLEINLEIITLSLLP